MGEYTGNILYTERGYTWSVYMGRESGPGVAEGLYQEFGGKVGPDIGCHCYLAKEGVAVDVVEVHAGEGEPGAQLPGGLYHFVQRCRGGHGVAGGVVHYFHRLPVKVECHVGGEVSLSLIHI